MSARLADPATSPRRSEAARDGWRGRTVPGPRCGRCKSAAPDRAPKPGAKTCQRCLDKWKARPKKKKAAPVPPPAPKSRGRVAAEIVADRLEALAVEAAALELHGSAQRLGELAAELRQDDSDERARDVARTVAGYVVRAAHEAKTAERRVVYLLWGRAEEIVGAKPPAAPGERGRATR